MFVTCLLSLALAYEELRQTTIFRRGDGGSEWYRIPCIATTRDNQLITVTDARWRSPLDLPRNISLVIRKSSDKGVTWTPTKQITEPNTRGFGDAAIVVDKKTGTIIVLYNGLNGFFDSTPTSRLCLYVIKSHDNGETWTTPIDITNFIYGNGCPDPTRSKWYSVFITSGSATQLRDGRIMAAIVVRSQKTGMKFYNYAIYSDDFGETWKVSNNSPIEDKDEGGDEAKIIELNDGRLLMSIRTKNIRRFAFSNDRGVTWDGPSATSILDPNCNGDIIRLTSVKDGFDKDRIIHTIPYNTYPQRKNVSVLLSYDEGQTWPVSKIINAKMSGYSSATIDQDGMIHVYYEENENPDVYDFNFNMSVASFSLEWLTDGQDSYKKPDGINWCVCDKADNDCELECPKDSYRFNSKVYDQYYDSYVEYPSSMEYTLISKVQETKIDLSIPGLKKIKYDNKFEEQQEMSIVCPDSSFNDKSVSVQNMIIHTSSSCMKMMSPESSFPNSEFVFAETVLILEVGSSKVRVTNLAGEKSVIPTKDFKISLDSNEVEIINGISDIEGESAALVHATLITKDNSKISISGSWNEDEIKNLKIVKPTSESKLSIITTDKKVLNILRIVEMNQVNDFELKPFRNFKKSFLLLMTMFMISMTCTGYVIFVLKKNKTQLDASLSNEVI